MNTSRHLSLALFLAATYPFSGMAAEATPAENTTEVVVVGTKQPYRSLSATGATKTDTPLKDLPQSARVLTADLLLDAGINRLADALDLGSGIARQNNFGGLWDSYSIRGFTGDPNYGSDYLVNGFSSSRGYNGLRDSANTSSVEILKGPAAALYGRGEPGGTINISTKKPLFQPAQTIEQSVGSFNTYRTALDVTGPLSETVAYRVNGAYEKGDSFRDTVGAKRYIFSPSFIWQMAENTTLSYELEAFEQKTNFDRGVVAVNGVLGLIPNSRYLGEAAGDGLTTVKSTGHQIFFQHFFNDDWSLQSGLGYRSSSLGGFSTETASLRSDLRTVWRQRRFRDFDGQDTSGRLELLGKFKTASIQHNFLVGVDGYRFFDSRIQLRKNPTAADPYALDIYKPIYGGVQPSNLPVSIDTDEYQWSTSFYAQDQLDLTQQWKALVGVRGDSYRQTFKNNRFAVVNNQSMTATSPRLGLVYQPTKELSLYASAAKGFRPNSGISINNESFPAETSEAFEAGFKLDTLGGKLNTTVAFFSIKKNNVLTVNPADTNFSLAAGEVGSKGIELDVAGDLQRNLHLSFSYAYTDAEVLRDNVLKVGGTLPGVPKHSANLLLVQDIALAGGRASFGGGMNYTGERNGDVAVTSTFNLPAYTTVKLLSSYSPNKKLRLSLDVDNLLNKQYYASSYQQTWVNTGSDRRITLKAQYKL